MEVKDECVIKNVFCKIRCLECDSFYIRGIQRPLLIRRKEHFAEIQHYKTYGRFCFLLYQEKNMQREDLQ